MPTKDFLFVNLEMEQEGEPPKAFDGMSAGTFTDMWGRETEFKLDEMQTYAVNTAFALESTRDSDGNIVGLPIDAMNHENREAAGWIVAVDLSEDGSKLRFTPRWNSLGRELIGGDYARFFSPTVDLKAKAVIGGSLTNWPATRTAANQILLRPIELSTGVFTHEAQEPPAMLTTMFDDLKQWITGFMKPGEKPEPEPDPEPELVLGVPNMPEPIVELSADQTAQLSALVEERAQTMFKQMVEAERRKTRILDFTRTVTGKGLPVQGEDLTAFLSSLTPEQLESAEALFSKIVETGGKIDFEEHGHSKTLEGAQPLPPEMAASLRTWIDAGQTVEDFFRVNAVELGAMTDYNLSDFEKKE